MNTYFREEGGNSDNFTWSYTFSHLSHTDETQQIIATWNLEDISIPFATTVIVSSSGSTCAHTHTASHIEYLRNTIHYRIQYLDLRTHTASQVVPTYPQNRRCKLLRKEPSDHSLVHARLISFIVLAFASGICIYVTDIDVFLPQKVL